MAMVYFNRTKQIKSLTIKYSNLNEGFIKQIESIVKDIAKQMNIDLSKPIDSNVTVYVYSSQMKSYFRNLFGEELTQREKQGAKAQMNLVISDEGEIHMLLSSSADGAKLAKLLVSTIFSGFIETKKISSVEKATKEIIEKRDKKEEEIEPEEPEEDIIEEEIEPEVEEPEEEVIEEKIESKVEKTEEQDQEIQETEIVDKIEEIIEKKEVAIPDWLEDGWYKYKKGYMNEVRSTDLGEYLKTHKVGKVEKMNGKASLLKEYDREHELKCTKVEYIVNTYGIKMLLKFFENPNVKEVFKLSNKEFNDDWKEYLKLKYINKTMKTIENKRITKDSIDTNKQEKSKIIE